MVVWCVNYVILQHYILHLYLIFFVNMERIYYLCKIKQQQPKQTSPLIYNVMITKHLQGTTDFCFLRQCNVWRVSPFLQSFSQ